MNKLLLRNLLAFCTSIIDCTLVIQVQIQCGKFWQFIRPLFQSQDKVIAAREGFLTRRDNFPTETLIL